MQGVRSRFLRALFLVAAWSIVAFAVLFPAVAPYELKRDRLEARPHAGVATVVILVPARTANLGDPMPAQVSVRFHGAIVAAQSVSGFQALRLDAPARIVYRIGRSGRIYVDHVEPMITGWSADKEAAAR